MVEGKIVDILEAEAGGVWGRRVEGVAKYFDVGGSLIIVAEIELMQSR